MASMAQPKMSFPEWHANIQECAPAQYRSDAPLDKDVYQPYTNKTARTKVIVPQVLDENTNKLLERIGSRKDIIVVLQMLPSNVDWFMLENYELYCKTGTWNVLQFHDILLYCGGKTAFSNKFKLNVK